MAWEAMAAAAAGQTMGMLGDGLKQGENLKAQRKAQKIQIEGNKIMGEFNRSKAMQMWEDTNYSAQRDQMEKAGLNVGLMYGMGGGGAATTATQAGAVEGGGAFDKRSQSGMGLQLGLQAELQKAQIDNIKTDTTKKVSEKNEIDARTPTHAKGMEKTDAEIQAIATRMGVDVATVRKLEQELLTEKNRTENVQADTELKGAQKEKVGAETTNVEANTRTTNEMRDPMVTGQKIMNLLNSARTKLTEEEARKVTREIIAISERIATDKTGNTIKQDANNIANTRNNILQELGNRGLDIQQQKMVMDGLLKIIPTLGKGSTPTEEPSTPWNYYNQ